MDAVLAAAATGVSASFALMLGRSWRARPRPHVLWWTVAMTAYTVGCAGLLIGVVNEWPELAFRVFYLSGAIASAPLLAVGSAFLVLGPVRGRRLAEFAVPLLLIASLVTLTAPLVVALPKDGIPTGRELFSAIGEVGPTGPRLWALVGNILGSGLLVTLAVRSIAKYWRTDRRRGLANLLVIAGTLAPATGGSLVALGEATGFALSLLVGAAALWAGYRVASG